MPIYEFYCPDCNTIYSFLSRTVNTEKCPVCPGCGKESLQRRVSMFAALSGRKEGGEEGLDDLPIDEPKMERAMESLAADAEGMDEEDPKAAARLMRKLSEATGLKYKDGMEEALGRLEAGEDPEVIEKEMGDLLEGDELPFELPGGRSRRGSKPPPRRDSTLYEM